MAPKARRSVDRALLDVALAKAGKLHKHPFREKDHLYPTLNFRLFYIAFVLADTYTRNKATLNVFKAAAPGKSTQLRTYPRWRDNRQEEGTHTDASVRQRTQDGGKGDATDTFGAVLARMTNTHSA